MKVEKRFLASVLLLSIIPLIGVVILIKTLFSSFHSSPSSAPSTPSAETATTLPVSPSNQHILTSMVIYNFSGKVIGISDTQINIDASLPLFPTSSATTKVFKAATTSKESTPAKYTDIKKGAAVVVSALYNLQTQQWYVTQITLQ